MHYIWLCFMIYFGINDQYSDMLICTISFYYIFVVWTTLLMPAYNENKTLRRSSVSLSPADLAIATAYYICFHRNKLK